MSSEDDLKRLGEATEEELEKAMKLDAALRQHAEEAGTVNALRPSLAGRRPRSPSRRPTLICSSTPKWRWRRVLIQVA